MVKRALVIGGGFGGCTAVDRLKKLDGWETTVVNPSDSFGGGVRTHLYSRHPHTFGPRHFLTHNHAVYDYLNSKIPLRLCKEHQFISFVDSDSQFYNYPIHFDDIPRMPESKLISGQIEKLETGFKNAEFKLTSGSPDLDNKASNYEDFWRRSVGDILYAKFIEKYTKKMWMIEDNKIIDDFTWSPKGVAIKRGPREGWDSAISAYPISLDGYNKFFDAARANTDIFYRGLVENVNPSSLQATIAGETHTYDLIINTAPLDELYKNCFGPLRYIGRRIEFAILPIEYALPKDVYFAYYTGEEPYTRIVEYKKFTRYESPNTLISLEYPDLNKGKYYPMPIAEFRELHAKYLEICHPMFFNVGRIAKYNYRYDIDDVIEQVLELTENI